MATAEMPRPKESGFYHDGTYEWYWDRDEGERGEWVLMDAAPYGMPTYPTRRRLTRVIKTRVPLTDDDFEED